MSKPIEAWVPVTSDGLVWPEHAKRTATEAQLAVCSFHDIHTRVAHLTEDRGEREALRIAVKALEQCHSALDMLMGDTDLGGDDSPEFKACQAANKAISAGRKVLGMGT